MINNPGIIINKLKIPERKKKRHDYDIYKENHLVIPKEVVNVVDRGYLGIEKDFPEQKSAISKRKKRNQDVTRRNRV